MRERGAANPPDQVNAFLDPKTSRSARMWELFVRHSREDLEFIQEAAAVEDAEALRRGFHRVKGSAYAFGARALGDKAAALELRARSGDGHVDAEVSELVRVFEQTCELMPTSAESGARQ